MQDHRTCFKWIVISSAVIKFIFWINYSPNELYGGFIHSLGPEVMIDFEKIKKDRPTTIYLMCVAGKDSSWRDRKSSLCRSWCFCFSGRSAISGFSISSSSSPGWQEKGAKGQTYTHLMSRNNDVRRENERGGGMQMYRLQPQTVSGALQADIKHMDAHLMSWNNEVPGELETPVSILSHFLFLHKILIMSRWDLQYKIQTASGNGSLFQFCISTLRNKAMPLISPSCVSPQDSPSFCHWNVFSRHYYLGNLQHFKCENYWKNQNVNTNFLLTDCWEIWINTQKNHLTFFALRLYSQWSNEKPNEI